LRAGGYHRQRRRYRRVRAKRVQSTAPAAVALYPRPEAHPWGRPKPIPHYSGLINVLPMKISRRGAMGRGLRWDDELIAHYSAAAALTAAKGSILAAHLYSGILLLSVARVGHRALALERLPSAADKAAVAGLRPAPKLSHSRQLLTIDRLYKNRLRCAKWFTYGLVN
jgi:hypothetical protein